MPGSGGFCLHGDTLERQECLATGLEHSVGHTWSLSCALLAVALTQTQWLSLRIPVHTAAGSLSVCFCSMSFPVQGQSLPRVHSRSEL